MGDSDLRPLLLVGTVSALGLTALIAIFALLSGDFGDTQVRILATTGGFGIASLISMRGTALLDRGLFLPLGWSVIGLSVLAFVLEFALIWISWNDEPEPLWKSFVVVVAFAGALGEIAGMLARRRTGDPNSITLLVWTAAGCALLLAFLASAAALDEVDDSSFYRFLGVAAVLNVPSLRRLERRGERVRAIEFDR